MPKRWVNHFALLAAWLAFWLIIGYVFGEIPLALLAGVSIYGVGLLRNVYHLDRVLATGKRPVVASTRGLWPELFSRVEILRRKSRQRKKRYVKFLREVQQSTGAINEAAVVLNSSYEIAWFNAAAEDLIGLDRATDIGQRLDNLVRDPEFVEYLQTDGGDPIVVRAPNQDDRMVSISLIPYGKEQFLAIARDVTRETQLENARRDFVANASHELRSPLTVVNGYLDALSDDPEAPDSWRAPIEEMLRQTHRMTQILRDLIELARLESADHAAELEFVDVREMLRKIVAEFRARAGGPALDLQMQTEVALLGSESELHSVFYNLISNAYRFTTAAGCIRVTWRDDDDVAVFEAEDSGIGIATEHIPRLTERFYRVDPGRSRASGGTGLGLAIVKHVLQRHDASLSIESTVGKGSTFACRFPSDRCVARNTRHSNVI